MKKYVRLLAFICLSSVLLCSCKLSSVGVRLNAPESHEFDLSSFPDGAEVLYDGKIVGVTPCKVTLPLKVSYSVNTLLEPYKKIQANLEKDNSMLFTFVKDGYEVGEVVVKPKVTMGENRREPAIQINYPEGVSCILEKKQTVQTVYEKDPTIVAGAADEMVSRDNPGGTALERTIIRWYFDSEPRGARIYWRVVSSIPSIVKNTNALYLGTTPYEETRSFNILGLTYENSRDVQIEIKLERPGYMEQVKRFNVRQAIDQQEISSFFEMVQR